MRKIDKSKTFSPLFAQATVPQSDLSAEATRAQADVMLLLRPPSEK